MKRSIPALSCRIPMVTLILVLSASLTTVSASYADSSPVILLNSGPIEPPATSDFHLEFAPSSSRLSPEARKLVLVTLKGPVHREWYEAIAATGSVVVEYIPRDTYLLWCSPTELEKILELANSVRYVQWIGDFQPSYKLDRAITEKIGSGSTRESLLLSIQLVLDEQVNRETLDLIASLRSGSLFRYSKFRDSLNILVELPAGAIPLVTHQPDVLSIQRWMIPEMHGERQDQIVAGTMSSGLPSGPGYLAWLAGKGFTQSQFTASGFAIDITDSGIDTGTTTPNHYGLYELGNTAGASRILYNRLEGTPNLGSTIEGCSGHGNINAFIAGGYSDLSGSYHEDGAGYHYGLGVCPFVRLGSSVIFDSAYTHPNFTDMMSRAWNDGARISNNSWGSNLAGSYTADSRTYDALVRDAQPAGSAYATAGNQEMVIIFSAGNDGPNAESIGAPGSAKNVITVGAAENVQAFGGIDGCGVGDSAADNADDMTTFSSRGPCKDGRMKPDLVAPGTHVSGGVYQVASPPVQGEADFCYYGAGVCGGPLDIFWPDGQQWYTASSGTSHAAPAVSGAAALLRQYFINNALTVPSPAMTKASLINSARYLTGINAADTLWSPTQGMGEVNLGTLFDGVPRILRDQLSADVFTASGQSRTWFGTVDDSARPFRVTLVWTDAPGSTVGAAWKNDLDLTVTVNGTNYLGNVFSGAASVTGGVADEKNNVESVFFPAGFSGSFSITVDATNINSDGIPDNGDPLDQDFALVIYNAADAPFIQSVTAELTNEECPPGNMEIDPGEKVTMILSLNNVGTLDTVNLTATLQESGGIIPISTTQTYGVVAAGDANSVMPFTFIAQGICGDSTTMTLELYDNGTNLGTIQYSLTLGTPGSCCTGTGPSPVPDGRWVAGTPLLATKTIADGSTAQIDWDTTVCAATEYVLSVGFLSSVSAYSYSDFSNCGLSATGSENVILPAGDLFFILVPLEGAVEGSHGRDSSAQERPATAVGNCAVTSKDSTSLCQ